MTLLGIKGIIGRRTSIGGRQTTHLKCVGLVALTSDHSNAINERYYLGRNLLLVFDLRVKELEPLNAGFASVVQDQIFALPFLREDDLLFVVRCSLLSR